MCNKSATFRPKNQENLKKNEFFLFFSPLVKAPPIISDNLCMEIGAIASMQLDNSLNSAERFRSLAATGNTAQTEAVSFADMLESAESQTAAPSHKNTPVIDKTSEIWEQCEALESYIMKILLSGMRKTVQKSGLIEQGFAGEMYEDMLYDEYATSLAKDSSLGFAKMAYLELTGQRGKALTDPAAVPGF
jgi:flagellar protein FlgJ